MDVNEHTFGFNSWLFRGKSLLDSVAHSPNCRLRGVNSARDKRGREGCRLSFDRYSYRKFLKG